MCRDKKNHQPEVVGTFVTLESLLVMQDLPWPPFFERTLFGASYLDWLIFLVLTIAFSGFFFFIRHLVVRHVKKAAELTENSIDDLVISVVCETKTYFLILAGAMAALLVHVLPPGVEHVIRRIVFVGFLLQVGQWGSHAVVFWINDYTTRKMGDDSSQVTAFKAMSLFARFLLWTLVLLLALDNFGVDVTSLIAGLGIGGIAVALALQNVLQDVFAYISIVVDQPFCNGDFLILDDYMGSVEHIGLKTTRLRSLSGEQLVFSNSDLLSSRIRNYKRMYERRVVFTVGIEYDTPADKVETVPAILREAIEAQDEIRFDRSHFKGYGDSSLDFETVYYVLKPDYNIYMDIQQAINLQIYRRFAAEGLSFAFPTRTIHVETVPEKLTT